MKNTPLKADERAFHMLIDRIISHKIQPGDWLYEPDLAETLQMSRTPIRHALSRLMANGILEKPRGKRGYTLPILTQEDMEEVFEARKTLEGKAAELAAHSRTQEDIDFLRQLNEEEKRVFANHQNKTEYAKLNRLFHKKIVEIAGNRYISRFFQQAYWRSSLYTFHFALFYNVDDPARSIPNREHHTHQEHFELINALEQRDGERARLLMEKHIRNTIEQRSVHFPSPQAIK